MIFKYFFTIFENFYFLWDTASNKIPQYYHVHIVGVARRRTVTLIS